MIGRIRRKTWSYSGILLLSILAVSVFGIWGCTNSDAQVTYSETYQQTVVDGYPITLKVTKAEELRFLNVSGEIIREIIFTRDNADPHSLIFDRKQVVPEDDLTDEKRKELEQSGFKQSGRRPFVWVRYSVSQKDVPSLVFTVRVVMDGKKESPLRFGVSIPTPALVRLFEKGDQAGAAVGFGIDPADLQEDANNIVEVVLERANKEDEKQILDSYK